LAAVESNQITMKAPGSVLPQRSSSSLLGGGNQQFKRRKIVVRRSVGGGLSSRPALATVAVAKSINIPDNTNNNDDNDNDNNDSSGCGEQEQQESIVTATASSVPCTTAKASSSSLLNRPNRPAIKIVTTTCTSRQPIMCGLTLGGGGGVGGGGGSSLYKKFQRPMMKRRAYDKSADASLKKCSLGVKRRFDGMAKLMARAGKGLTFQLPRQKKRGGDGTDDSSGDEDEDDTPKWEEHKWEPLCVWSSPFETVPQAEQPDSNCNNSVAVTSVAEVRGLPGQKVVELQPDEYGIEREVTVFKAGKYVYVDVALFASVRYQIYIATFVLCTVHCLSTNNASSHLIFPFPPMSTFGFLLNPHPTHMCTAPKQMYAKKSVMVPDVVAKWLRPHQREGVQFLYECVMSQRDYAMAGPEPLAGCILADDMGLGKTLQSITLLFTMLKSGITVDGVPSAKRVIIVCPCSLVKNWDAEIIKWIANGGPGPAPGVPPPRVMALAECDRATIEKNLDTFCRTNLFSVLIASYECIRTHIKRLTSYRDSKCDLLICDEAHRLKNRDNQTTRALHSLPCKRRVLLTG
jgi:hypothetical protein